MPLKSEMQIFLAHASEDKATVLKLYDQLEASGYKPWIDAHDLIPGQNWRAAIPKAIKSSAIFIACLSSASVAKRGYIQKEFRMAMEELGNIPPDEIYLIPLRLDECEIPDLRQSEYGLNLQDLHWSDYWQPDGFEKLIRAIALKFGVEDSPQPETVITSDYIYIERPPIESRCFQEVVKPGAVIRIQAPQRMGTTMLISRIFDYVKERNYRIVLLNLLRANESTLQDLETFLKWFCKQVGRQLKLENQLADYWEEDSGPNDNCTAYFEDYLLENLDSPLVLGLENLDRIFQYQTVAASFLGLLRAWHEDAKYMERWQKLRLVLAVSTEVFIPLDINQSPFNVGLPIELPEFNLEQVQELAKKYGLNWTAAQAKQLMAIVGGHPYLVDFTLNEVKASGESLAVILDQAHTEAGIFHRHLRKLWLRIEGKSELIAALKTVVNSEHPVAIDRDRLFELDSMGLVKKQGNQVEPRCQLYRLYFQDRLK